METVGTVYQKSECNKFLESLLKVQTLPFQYGNHENMHLKSTVSLNLPLRIFKSISY